MTWTLCLLACLSAEPLGPGNHLRSVDLDGAERTYFVHVPPRYDSARPTPVVLCFHGALTAGRMNMWFTGINRKSDEAGFVVVHPNGQLWTWNSGGFPRGIERRRDDDVEFTRRMLDDLATVVTVDPKRVFACGMSNGAMMCHRLGVELSDRIAAIAPVAGTLSIDHPQPKRPMPVLQIHGTDDTLVPWNGSPKNDQVTHFRSVQATIDFWVKFNRCTPKPLIEKLPNKTDDGTTVTRFTYANPMNNAEVVLIKIAAGGHTWPGRDLKLGFLGSTTLDIDANDLIWEFFEKHAMP